MLLKDKKVAIIGAGPVGLTMAKLLQQKGVDVTVYERDKDAQTRVWGGPLDLHPETGQQAMKNAGLLDSYFATGIPMGRIITDVHAKILFAVAPQYDTPEINRNHLRTILLDSLASGTVVWDRKFAGLSKQGSKWLLHFEDKPDAVADLVIGANGGLSGVRKYVTNAEIEYTGTYIIQGEVYQPEVNCPSFYALCNGNILMAAKDGITFTANPKNNDALTYGISFRKSEEWVRENGLDFQDTKGIAAFLSGMFSEWHKVYPELFNITSFFAGLPARKISLDKSWKISRPLPITLIGDAAHIMPPFAGQGVNTGLKDALILSDNLTNGKFDTIEAAITDYEQQMFAYAGKAQLETAFNEVAMHQPDFSFKQRFSN